WGRLLRPPVLFLPPAVDRVLHGHTLLPWGIYPVFCVDRVSPLQNALPGKALSGVSRAPGTHRGGWALVRLYLWAHPPGHAGVLALARQGKVLATARAVVRAGLCRGLCPLDHHQCADSLCRARGQAHQRVGALRTRTSVGRLGPSLETLPC